MSDKTIYGRIGKERLCEEWDFGCDIVYWIKNLDEYDPVFLYEMLNAPNIREKMA